MILLSTLLSEQPLNMKYVYEAEALLPTDEIALDGFGQPV